MTVVCHLPTRTYLASALVSHHYFRTSAACPQLTEPLQFLWSYGIQIVLLMLLAVILLGLEIYNFCRDKTKRIEIPYTVKDALNSFLAVECYFGGEVSPTA